MRGLTVHFPDIDTQIQTVYIAHERTEKEFPLHQHSKGQLTYTEGGISYITIENKTYIVPVAHFFWIPKNVPHHLRVAGSATVVRNLYFYSHDDTENDFYNQLAIYPASKLLVEMINYTENWDERHVDTDDKHFPFLVALKRLLPEHAHKALPIVLPITTNERMTKIIAFLETNIAQPLSLEILSTQFNMSERSIIRLFKSTMHISFWQYLKTLRMIRAIEMLIKTTAPINEIAFNVGYDTIGAFSNAFLSLTQARPSDFRKKQLYVENK